MFAEKLRMDKIVLFGASMQCFILDYLPLNTAK